MIDQSKNIPTAPIDQGASFQEGYPDQHIKVPNEAAEILKHLEAEEIGDWSNVPTKNQPIRKKS